MSSKDKQYQQPCRDKTGKVLQHGHKSLAAPSDFGKLDYAPSSALAEDGASLYIHYPYCLSKCNYCDFNSWALSDQSTEDYIRAVLLEAKNRALGLNPQTVFIGGGTPSLMGEQMLQLLLDGLHDITNFRESAIEVTIEANPESFHPRLAEAAIHGGCTRLSLGAQSFQEDVLKAYDRAHSASDIETAFHLARSVGFKRINLDLIFAFPGQPAATWETDFRRAAQLGAEHLSCYELSYEPNTQLTRLKNSGRWKPEDSATCKDLFQLTRKLAAEYHLIDYEVSNFSKPQEACLHNLAAWRNLKYIGLGAGAASWIPAPPQGGVRQKNISSPLIYQNAVHAGASQLEENETRAEEFALFDLALMGLRLTHEGLSVARALSQTGINPLDYWERPLAELTQKGWIRADSQKIVVSPDGLLFLDSILEVLLPQV